MQSKYRVFVESFVLTVFIFMIAFSLGIFVESYRTDRIIQDYKNYEIQALDLKLQNYYYQIMDAQACDIAIQQYFQFADQLYDKGLELEKYEEANQISDDLLREKKRYVLLKTELWLNSILLKKKCNNPFDTIVYLYSADPSNNVGVAQQKVISNELKSLKEKYGNKIILLPIAGDLRIGEQESDPFLGIVELQKKMYKIDSLPSIIINEKAVLEGYHSSTEIEKFLSHVETSKL
ncbi:MAG: hypothetical protein RL557_47 [archaeon]